MVRIYARFEKAGLAVRLFLFQVVHRLMVAHLTAAAPSKQARQQKHSIKGEVYQAGRCLVG